MTQKGWRADRSREERAPSDLARIMEMKNYGDLDRIAQEILNNTLKHSKAGELVMELMEKENMIHFSTCDDGSGLSEEEASDPSSFQSIRGRVAALGGHIDVLPNKGHGLSFDIRVPVA